MRIMTICALALAVGCGGGGGATTTTTAQLAGTVYEVDGQRFDLEGVQVTLKETGEWAWTDTSGSFEFGGLEPGIYTLDFMGDGDVAAGGDEFSDGAGDPKVDVPEGGRVEIRVAIEDGEVKDFSSDCDKEQSSSATARLELTDAAEAEGYEVCGKIKIAESEDGTLFKVCVEGLAGGDVIEVFVSEASIGTATADEDGRACVVLENDLPGEATSLDELAGRSVEVFLSETDPALQLLTGEIPALAEEHDGDYGDKPDDDGEDPAEDGTGDEGEGDSEDGEDCDKPDGDDGTDGEGGSEGGSGEGEGDPA